MKAVPEPQAGLRVVWAAELAQEVASNFLVATETQPGSEFPIVKASQIGLDSPIAWAIPIGRDFPIVVE